MAPVAVHQDGEEEELSVSGAEGGRTGGGMRIDAGAGAAGANGDSVLCGVVLDVYPEL